MTERLDALKESSLSDTEKVCFTASDYLRSLSNKKFAEAYGGSDLLFEDLVWAVSEWQNKL